MTDKLLDCPFCGRKAVKVGFHNGVQCPTAYCAGNAMVVEPSQWNRRAQPDMGNLQRSEVVHANMILYRIAKLTPAQVAHLYTDEECAEIVTEIQRQRPEAVKPAQPDTRLVEAAMALIEAVSVQSEDGRWGVICAPALHEPIKQIASALAAIRAQKEGK